MCTYMQQYAWPLMSTLFSEVLSREAWLRTWDNILSNPPGFLLLVVVAYLTIARSTLLQCTQKEDFEVRWQIVHACDGYIHAHDYTMYMCIIMLVF